MTEANAFGYQKRMEDLALESWLVDTFRPHLNTGDWPNDKALSPLVWGIRRSESGMNHC